MLSLKTILKFILSFVLGGAFALSIANLWLIDYFPPDSKRSMFFVALIFLLLSLSYLALWDWFFSQMAKYWSMDGAKIIISSLVVGAVLFYLSSNTWQKENRYFRFFLPEKNFTMSVTLDDLDSNFDVTWITMSVGDLSYSQIDVRGWALNESALSLTNPFDNSLEWHSKAGEEILIVFNATGSGVLRFWINDNENVVSFSKDREKLKFYLAVPWYASRQFNVLFGLMNFILLSLIFVMAVWPYKNVWLFDIEESLMFVKEFRYDWALVVALVFFSVILRIFDLDTLPPYLEEYAHLNAAKQYLMGATFGSIYQRSFYLVTLPVIGVFSLFGFQVWMARLPGVLFSSLAVVPLYLGMKKFNRPIAIISSILYATSPWLITQSRIIREYAYFPIFYYMTVFLMISYLKEFPEKFSFDKFKTLFRPKMLQKGILLLIPIVYSLVINASSTFSLILLAYAVFFLFIFRKIDFRDTLTLFLSAVVLSVGLIVGESAIAQYSNKVNVNYINLINFPKDIFITVLGYFFPSPAQQWYFNRLSILPIVSFLCVIGFVTFSRLKSVQKFKVSFFLLLVIIPLFSFIAFFTGPLIRELRYYTLVQLGFIPLEGIGLYFFWKLLLRLANYKYQIAWMVAIVIGLVTININHILLSQLGTPSRISSITRLGVDDFSATESFLIPRSHTDDALISYDFGRYALFYDSPVFEKIYTTHPWYLGLREHDTGWIVINEKYYTNFQRLFPQETFWVGDKKVEYLGEVVGQHVDFIWYWKPNSTSN